MFVHHSQHFFESLIKIRPKNAHLMQAAKALVHNTRVKSTLPAKESLICKTRVLSMQFKGHLHTKQRVHAVQGSFAHKTEYFACKLSNVHSTQAYFALFSLKNTKNSSFSNIWRQLTFSCINRS